MKIYGRRWGWRWRRHWRKIKGKVNEGTEKTKNELMSNMKALVNPWRLPTNVQMMNLLSLLFSFLNFPFFLPWRHSNYACSYSLLLSVICARSTMCPWKTKEVNEWVMIFISFSNIFLCSLFISYLVTTFSVSHIFPFYFD